MDNGPVIQDLPGFCRAAEMTFCADDADDGIRGSGAGESVIPASAEFHFLEDSVDNADNGNVWITDLSSRIFQDLQDFAAPQK